MQNVSVDSQEIKTAKKQDAAERLGTEPIGRLLVRFSIPGVAGMLLTALYNIVDRIFVGRGVNELALGGLALIMPLMTISMAFSVLFGGGSANLISMRLGQGRRDEARNALNHCFFLLFGVGLSLMILGFVFMEPLLSLLGAQKGSESIIYARNYLRIILLGSPFFSVGFGFSHCTRAQGFPMITLISMIFGAVLNMILDPIFIFIFHWGVEGAAWATIISQIASSIWLMSFVLSKRAVVRLSPRSIKPSLTIIRNIMAFGSSQFILQFVMSGIQLLTNTSMGWYGEAALGVSNGGDIAVSGMNIIGSFMMMTLMPIFGINQGAQPIQGFNYGAKKFDRVLRTYLLAISAATVVCLIGFSLVQLFPRQLISLFVPDSSPPLMRFTTWGLRVMMLLFPLVGFQAVSANFFVVTGRPKISIFLSMLRQCIILLPCILIFGRIWGLWGVVAAGPVSDGGSFIITVILISFELRKLRQQIKKQSLHT